MVDGDWHPKQKKRKKRPKKIRPLLKAILPLFILLKLFIEYLRYAPL
jgi:hypothetical protein